MLVSTWSDTNIQFNFMDTFWDRCQSRFVWNRAKLKWKYWNITWEDIQCLAEAAVRLGGGLDYFYEWQKAQAEAKKRQLVYVICRVKGIKYEASAQRKNVSVSAEDVRLAVRELGIEVFIDDVDLSI